MKPQLYIKNEKGRYEPYKESTVNYKNFLKKMNALEARAQALETQKARWMKLHIDTRKAIESSVSCGSMSCFVEGLYEVEIQCLRMLGYNVRDIIEDTFEISW